MGAPDAILVLLDGVRHVDDSSHRAAPIRPVGDILGAPILHNANHQPAVSCTGIAQLKQPRETLRRSWRRSRGSGPVVRSCRRAEIPVVLAVWPAAEVVPTASSALRIAPPPGADAPGSRPSRRPTPRLPAPGKMPVAAAAPPPLRRSPPRYPRTVPQTQ